MVNFQIRTRFGEQTLLHLADTFFKLLVTRGSSEICCRSSHIVYISLKSGFNSHPFCFFQNRLMASDLNNSSLMKCEGTEITAAKTSTATCQTKLNLGNCRNTACCLIGWMIRSHIRIGINIIHFLRSKWLCRWILHNQHFIRICFN